MQLAVGKDWGRQIGSDVSERLAQATTTLCAVRRFMFTRRTEEYSSSKRLGGLLQRGMHRVVRGYAVPWCWVRPCPRAVLLSANVLPQ